MYQDWDFNYFLDDPVNILVDFNNLWNNFLDFYDFGDVDSFFDQLLNFVNFWNLGDSVNDFFYDLPDFFDLLNHSFNGHNFFSQFLYFNHSILNVRNNFFDLFDSLLDYHVINLFFDFDNFNLFLLYWHYSVPKFVNLFNFPVNDFDGNHFFNDSVNWNLNFNRNNYVSIDLDDFWLFNNIGHYFVNLESSRNLPVLDNYPF